jgi:hypothetical protein
MKYIAGIDDTGTGTQISQGWSYFLIPETALPPFASKGTALLTSAKLKAFHAKKFKVKQRPVYTEFLKLIYETIHAADYGFGGSILNGASWKKDLQDFSQRVVTNALANNGITDEHLVKTVYSFAEPIWTLISETNADGHTMDVEIDTDEIKKGLSVMSHQIRTTTIKAEQLVRSISNGFRTFKFQKAPEVASVTAVSDNNSMVVQAADIIGNFQMSYIFRELGDTSKTRICKAEIFEEVFGADIEKLDFNSCLRLRYEDDGITVATDLELLTAARLKLLIGKV